MGQALADVAVRVLVVGGDADARAHRQSDTIAATIIP
jgi:hypothetical protein